MRLIFVEGIIGAGKSTNARRIADHLGRRGLGAHVVSEGSPLLRVGQQLPHPYAPWSDVSIDGYIDRCRESWRSFLGAQDSGLLVVCDGLLFHGNMTDLLLMGADAPTLMRYFDVVLETIRPTGPRLVYLRTLDVAAALRSTCDRRGAAWETYQLTWKLASPYARARGLTGFDGFARFYVDYRNACDALAAGDALPTLRLDDDRGWPERERDMIAWVDA
ncbi:MAG TPA: hypothetical protein VEP48_08160 [Methylomirabilota bacterium]|nr:hypothetical protein [Methylomirabilota bacterium]